MNLIDTIRIAFAARKKPHRTAIESAHPEYDDIYDDAMHFSNLTWEETDYSMWRKFSEAAHGLTPEAFCYFLPGIMTASIVKRDAYLYVADSVIYSLDRAADKSPHDIERWKILSPSECHAVKEWLLWVRDIHNSESDDFLGNEISRALATLEALENRSH